MIASIRGTVLDASAGSLVIDVGGVGLSVTCTPQTAMSFRTGESVTLATALVVREDSLTLFGFNDADQRDVFEAVQMVSGVGPRTALALLATLTPDDLRRALTHEDLVTLMRVPGIGRKGAQRLVLELKDRLGPSRSSDTGAAATGMAWQEAVRAGLESLGWSAREADAAVQAVPSPDGQPDVSALLRQALQSLDRA